MEEHLNGVVDLSLFSRNGDLGRKKKIGLKEVD